MSDWKGTPNENLALSDNFSEFINGGGINSKSLTPSLSKLSDDFSEFMVEPITITPLISKNKFGEPVYDTFSQTVMGLVIQKLVQLSDKDNQIVNSNSQIFVDGNTEINMSDRILFNNIIPEIKYIKSIPDENGIYVKIIYI
jgi:hypothetical protein